MVNEKETSKDVKFVFQNRDTSPRHQKHKAMSQYSDKLTKASMSGGHHAIRTNFSMHTHKDARIDNSAILPTFSIKSPVSALS